MKKPRTIINLFTGKVINNRESALLFFENLLELIPEAVPDRFDKVEPLKQKFNSDRIEDVLPFWSNHFFWNNRKSQLSGRLFHGTRHGHSTIKFIFRSKSENTQDCAGFLKKVGLELEVDFAYVHLVDKDLPEKERVLAGVTSKTIQRQIPPFPWAAILGVPFKKILLCTEENRPPIHAFEKVSDRCFFFQLTRSLFDVKEDYSGFDFRRKELEEFLGLRPSMEERCSIEAVKRPDFVFEDRFESDFLDNPKPS